jgi:hypothetical protein
MSIGLGIVEEDFLSIVDDLGVAVSWEAVTKTEKPISGDETLTYATAVDKKIYFMKTSQSNQLVKEGIVASGDVVVLADKDFGFAKDDKITYDGKIYIIKQDPIKREAGGDGLFVTCYLREYDDE